MGCGPSKSSSPVHPVTSRSYNRAERTGITSPESTEAPPSTPRLTEPQEIPLLPGQPQHDEVNCGTQQQHALLGALQEALQGTQREQRHRLWRQPRITESEDTYLTSSNATDSAVEQSTAAGHGVGGTIYSFDAWQHPRVGLMQGQDQRWPVSNGITVDPFARLPSPSSRSNFHPGVPANIPLQVYGTDSQVEFFKMLDKKINAGPDCSVSDSEDSG